MFNLQQDRRLFLKSISLLSATNILLYNCNRNEPFVDATLAIACWGDSLTAGTGGIPYTSFLKKSFPNRPVMNFSIGGQKAQQIAARQGGIPVTITIENNAFREERAINLNSISTKLLSTEATNKTFYLKGKVNGIDCTLARKLSGSFPNQTEIYTLSPSIPSVQSVPSGSIFISDEAEFFRSSFQIFWMGRNDIPNFDGIDKLLDNCISYLNNSDHYLVIGVLSDIREVKATTIYNKTIAFNELLEVKYKDRYVSVSPPTSEELNTINYSPTFKDIFDINNGVFPTGLRADNTHLNTKGYELIANRVIKKLREQGI